MIIIKNNIIPFKGFKVINLCGILFVRKGDKMTDIDLNHESIHSAQIIEMLIIFFYIWYGIEWIIKYFKYKNSKKFYRAISFEAECYKNQDNLDYLKTRKHYAWTKYC